MLASILAAGLMLLQGQALDKIVVTAGPPLDTTRLADALRVYLNEFGIAVEPGVPDQAGDLRERLADARRLGRSVRAVAVIRAETGAPDEIEIELTDLATDKTLIATLPKPARDADLYRTLALKIQAILRATLSEARGTLDPGSAVGRLVSGRGPPPPVAPLALLAGYQALSLTASGVILQGLSLTATYSLARRVDLSLGTALLSSTQLSRGGVDAVAGVVPVLVAARARWRRDRVALAAGPGLEVGVTSVTALSSVVPVRSSRDLLLAVGADGEAAVRVAGPLWAYLRAAALGVVKGARYDIEGVPVLDTSRLQIALGAGLGVRFP
jgi:hypothetical protein